MIFFYFVSFEQAAGTSSYYQHSALLAELQIKRVITLETFCNFYTALINLCRTVALDYVTPLCVTEIR